MKMQTNPEAKPSSFLNLITSTTPLDILQHILIDHLSPALDTLTGDDRNRITTVLSEALHDVHVTQNLIEKIDYNGHRDSLEGNLQKLHNTEADPPGLRLTIAQLIDGEVRDWLSTLWKVGVEKRRNMATVHRCLILCINVTRRMRLMPQPVPNYKH